MLPKSHQKKLTQWQDLLLDLRSQVKNSSEALTIKSSTGQELQNFFKKEILPLNNDVIEVSFQSVWQSFQTESYRSLRLLNTDIIFLTSSKSIATRQKRLSQIEARLEQMIGYCQSLLSSCSES
mgnify:CR=1 FL=1